jgi:hypothetical protein
VCGSPAMAVVSLMVVIVAGDVVIVVAVGLHSKAKHNVMLRACQRHVGEP